jgi:hypothetical protein
MIIFIIVSVYHKFLSVPEKIFPSPSWSSTVLEFVAFFNLLSFGRCIIQYLQYVHPRWRNIPVLFNLLSCPHTLSLFAVLGQLNGLMVILYHQFNKKERKKTKNKDILW